MNDNNEKSLRMLARAISRSRGDFSLILAHCNYTELRQELTEQLQARRDLGIRQIVLDPSAVTLETSIDAELEPEPPSALMISGLELVRKLEEVLAAANNARDGYRQKYPFPLVLWVTDEVEKQMRRIAPDFTSWAKVPIEFDLSTDRLIEKIEQGTDAVFAKIEEAGADRFLDNTVLNLQSGSPLCWELSEARSELKSRGVELDPAIEASLEFVLGRAAIEENLSQSRDHYEKSKVLFDEVLSAGSVEGNESRLLRKKGCVLFSLGLWWRSYGVQHRKEKQGSSSAAKEYFQQAVEVLEQANSPDLVAKFINGLGDELQRRKEWDELDAVAKKAKKLHKTYHDIFRLARADGFLAEVALAKKAWKQAQRDTQKARDRLDQVDQSDNWSREISYYRSCYEFALARVHKQQGKISEAIQHLKTAKEQIKPNYDPHLKTAKEQIKPNYDPLLYIEILKELRDSYFQQKEYRQAFDVKQEQQSIESQFGFRAFIGAGPLSPRQHLLPVGQGPGGMVGMVPEIAASGREQDVERLVDRMASTHQKMTVIYGPSGVGKSSILQAGLIPALQSQAIGDRDVLPVLQRVYTNWIAELGKCLARSLKMTVTLDETTAILNRLRSNAEANLLTVLIFDQFEEFFIACQKPKQRQEFYEFLKTCLDIEYVKVILSLREDYLHYLSECNDRLVSLDAIGNDILGKNVLYYLGNFKPQDAKAVMRSLTEQSQFHLEEALLDELVEELAGELSEVRPIELQVVGAQLQTEDINTLAEYRENGPKEKLVERYLAEVVNDCGEENKQTAEQILYLLTDENNTRPLKTRAELEKELKNVEADLAVEADKLDLVLDLFVKAGLVFEVPETTGDRYQLVHDYLVQFVRQRALLAKQEAEREQRKRSERRRNRFLKAATLLVAILSFGTVIYARRATNNEIIALSQSSEILCTSKESLDSLIPALKAGIKVKPTNWIEKWWIDADTRNQALTTLQKAVYGVRERNRLSGHDDAVLVVAFSPDGKILASASDDRTVKLWNADDGKLIRTISGHDGQVLGVAFSPDGKTIASASTDKTVKLWNADDGTLLRTLKGHDRMVWRVAFSPDSKTIASASLDGTVKLWHASNGTLLRTLKGHDGQVLGVAFSPDGKIIASASTDKTVKLWNADDGTVLRTLEDHDLAVYGVAFSPDGKTIASASRDKTVKLWNADDGTLLRTLSGHDKLVRGVAFSPDGKIIASASEDRTVKLWNADDGTLLRTLSGHDDMVRGVAFSPDGKIIASASGDRTVKLWQADDGLKLRTLKGHDTNVIDVAFSPDGKIIASASIDKKVKLWNASDGKWLRTLTDHDEVYSVAFSPDGKIIASASKDKKVKLWNASDGTLLGTLRDHDQGVRGVAFSPDGKIIASASYDKTVKLWNASDGTLLRTLTDHIDGVIGVAFSPNGKILASASLDGTVKLWNADDGLKLRTLTDHIDGVRGVAFSPDGKIIASASKDKTVKLWNASDGKLLRTLTGHDEWVWGVTFSPDGKIIASASKDKTVKLWDASDGKLLRTLTGHDEWINDVAFSPDGKIIASPDDRGNIILLNFDLDDLLVRGCNWARDYLKHNPNVDETDRTLCDGIGTQE